MTAPRDPKPMVDFIGVSCAYCQDLLPEARSFENFKDLHLRILSDIKRKSLPEIAKVAEIDNSQSLHLFLRESPCSADEFENRRLQRILETVGS